MLTKVNLTIRRIRYLEDLWRPSKRWPHFFLLWREILFWMSFQMYRQSTCSNSCKVTLAAFERFFPRVNFQMCTEFACKNRCKLAKVAFERFLSKVPFQMFPQVAFPNRYKITFVAFVWLAPNVSLQMIFQTVCPHRGIVALVAFVGLLSRVNFRLFTKLCHFVPFFKKFLLIWILSEKWKWKVPFLSEI